LTPGLKRDEDLARWIFVGSGFVEMVGNGLELGLQPAEVQRVDDALEELLPDAGLARRRPCEKVAEKFLSQNRLNWVIWRSVEDHLAPLVDREAVGVDLRTLQPLGDDLQGFFESRVVALG